MRRRVLAGSMAGREACRRPFAGARELERQSGDSLDSDPPVHHLSVRRHGQAHWPRLVGRHGDVDGAGQHGISVARHDLAGQLAPADQRDDARHAVLGAFVFGAHLAAADARRCLSIGHPIAHGNRNLFGHGHLRIGYADRQPGIRAQSWGARSLAAASRRAGQGASSN